MAKTERPPRVRLNAEYVKLTKEGQTLKAIFKGRFEREVFDRDEDGLIRQDDDGACLRKMVGVLKFEDAHKHIPFLMWEDGGLKNALASANLQVDQGIEIEYLGQKELKGGKRCNDYAFYPLN